MVSDQTNPSSINELTPILKLAPATAPVQHFLSNLRESFWGDLKGPDSRSSAKVSEADSERQRDRFGMIDAYERNAEKRRGEQHSPFTSEN